MLNEGGKLGLAFAGQPFQQLLPWKPRRFRVKEFSDVVYEFVVGDGQVRALKQINPAGEYTFVRMQ